MGITLPAITQRIVVDESGFSSGIGRLGSKMGGVGRMLGTAVVAGAAAATVAVGAFAAKGVKDAAAVDKGLREVNALFGRTGPEAEAAFDRMRAGVAGLSDEVGIAQDVLVNGLYQAISAGVPEDNAFEFMKVASEASIAGVTDVETAVDGLTTTINAFGLENKDAQAVADSMFATVQGGKTTFAELSDSLFNVAPAAAAAKVNFQEVNAAIATLTASGTPTSVATTQLRAALTGLQAPSKDLDAIFQELGYKNAQLAIESKGLGFALDAVKDASGGSNGELQKLLGSSEAVAAANVIAGTGARKFADELARQKDSAGAATGAYEEMQKSASVQFDRLKVQLQNVGITLGAAILPHLTKIMGWISANVPRWVDYFKQTFDTIAGVVRPIINVIKDVVAGFGGLGEGGQVGGILSSFMGVVERVRATFSSVFAGEGGIGGIISTIVPIISGAMSSIMAIIKSTLDLIGVVWDLVGDDILRTVVGVFKAVWRVISGVLRAISGIIDTVLGVLTGDWSRAWKGIQNIFGGVWDAIKGLIRGAWTVIKGIFGAAFSVIGRLISGWVRMVIGFWTSLGEAIGRKARELWELAKAVFSAGIAAVVEFVRGLPGKAVAALSSIGSKIASTLSTAWRMASAAVRDGISAVIEFVRGLPGRAVSALGSIGSSLWSAGRDLIQGLLDGIANMASAVADKAREVVNGAISAAKSALGISSPSKEFRKIGRFVGKGFVAGMTDERSEISETTRELAKLVRDAFDNRGTQRLWTRWIADERDTLTGLARQREGIANRLANARDRLQSAVEMRADFARSMTSDLVGNVTELVPEDDETPVTIKTLTEGLRDRLAAVRAFQADLAKLAKRGLNKGVLRQLAEAGVEGGAATADALARATMTDINNFNRLQGALVSTSKRTGGAVSDELYTAGVQAARGMVSGLKTQEDAIGRQMVRIAEKMQKAIRKALGIHSPSRVFAGIGEATAAGLADGLLGGRREVARAVGTLADGMAPLAATAINFDPSRARGGDGASAPTTAPPPTLAPTYNVRTYDPAETARVIATENGWQAALARY